MDLVQIKKEDLKKGMNYFTIKRNCPTFKFVDQCKQTGNVFTFLRIKGYINGVEKIINEELSVNSNYFNTVELYKLDQIENTK
jgi:hypothetical protein